MTVVDSAAALTRVINDTTKEFDITEASLDTKVTSIQASETAAIADSVEASGYRDTTAAHANTVATDLATVQSNVTYDGIAAILESKAVTAVDVFIYDTSLDSDGGAWRKRCQHTSWYNEPLNTATRGARREFPAVAVIVAEADKVTIYDGDDPALPMWMVLDDLYALWPGGRTATGIAAMQGEFLMSTTVNNDGGLISMNFISDKAYRINADGTWGYINISQRNSITPSLIAGSPSIVSSYANDVAMTVLPDAPIDPATGLPVPVIAVATAGGVSVIKDGGTVVNPTPYVGKYTLSLDIAANGDLFCDGVLETTWADSYAPYANGTWATASLFSYSGNYPTTREYSYTHKSNLIVTPFGFAGEGELATSSMLYQMMLDPSNIRNGSAIAYTTSTYNTGWMNGDIKGAFLADTDDTDLVGGELVTNGGFATNDLTGWTDTSIGTGTVDASSGAAALFGTDAINRGKIEQAVSVTAGKLYRVTFDVVRNSGALGTGFITTSGAIPITTYEVTSGPKEYFLVAPAGAQYFAVTTHIGGGDATIDNISIKLADPDRSVNNKGLIVNGTITRSPVATGAELVGYSGFSASNYLEQSYNADFDFGTGDFCIMGWIKGFVGNHNQIFYRGGYVSNGIQFYYDNAYRLRVGTTKTVLGGVRTDTWQQIIGLRRSGNLFLYMNGELISGPIDASTVNLDGSYPIEIGKNLAGSLALLRISASAPSPDQIKKIYEDEKALFQENAACTLYGASGAVTALAHDPKTNLLHVGTSAGRSIFNGLERIDNTTTPVTTAISAVNGLIAEQ